MIGITGLHNLRVDCIVGVYPHEREKTQAVFLDIELSYDFAFAAQSDSIADAVDYDRVASLVTKLIQARKFQLIEAMATATAEMLLDKVPEVQNIRLEVRKPAAVPAASHSFVRVERQRT